MQEIIELVVFGLIALLLGTGLLWVLGWLFGLAGIVFKFVAGFVWSLLRFIVPIVIIGGVAYALVRYFQNRSERPTSVETVPPPPPPAPVEPVSVDGGTGAAAAGEAVGDDHEHDDEHEHDEHDEHEHAEHDDEHDDEEKRS